jgi:peptidyl-prolyl cis-trans isomerase A (cyclophilin A)
MVPESGCQVDDQKVNPKGERGDAPRLTSVPPLSFVKLRRARSPCPASTSRRGLHTLASVNRPTFLRCFVLSLFAASLAFALPARAADPIVVLKTSLGTITVQLDPAHAPLSTANFLDYVDKKFYDGTIFHRVIPGFMVQGGGFTPDMTEKPAGAPIKNEGTNGLHNLRGTIAMARTADPDSATAQFYLNLVDNGALDATTETPGYAVFGKVIGGLDVLDKIALVPTTTKGMYENVPVDAVTLISARRK